MESETKECGLGSPGNRSTNYYDNENNPSGIEIGMLTSAVVKESKAVCKDEVMFRSGLKLGKRGMIWLILQKIIKKEVTINGLRQLRRRNTQKSGKRRSVKHEVNQ